MKERKEEERGRSGSEEEVGGRGWGCKVPALGKSIHK